jgi:CRISPR-associated endonuclease Cas1 subtype II
LAGFRTVVINKTAKLEVRLGYLVVRDVEEKRIHISELETLMVESTAVSLTAMLLSELAKSGVNVVFCDEKHLPESQLLPLYGNFAASGNIHKQIEWDEAGRALCWSQIIRDKILMQARTLDLYGHNYEGRLLTQYAGQVASADKTNREGHAAKVYFNSLFGKEFERRSQSAVNAALNYGYSILLSAFSREIVAAGYLTQIGVWHRGGQNPYNLACDLMESFRPIADGLVRSFSDAELENFKTHIKKLFLASMRIDGKRQYLSAAVRCYAHRIFRFLSGETDSVFHISDVRFEDEE